MFVVNDDLSIYATRGDIVCLNVSATDDSTGGQYEFQPGDIVRMKIFAKKDAENVVMQKDFPVVAKTDSVGVYLDESDTKIGDVISKPTDYWYEIELNPYTNPQTIVGYDEDGAKIFKLFPEGKDLQEEPVDPETVAVMDTDLDLTSSRPVENRAIARAVTLLKNDLETVNERLTGKVKANEKSGKDLLERFDNLIAMDKPSLSQNLDYLEVITDNTKAKIDGRIESDGVFANIKVNLREANLIYGGTTLDLFVIPVDCRPMYLGLIHTEDGLEYSINHNTNGYYMSIRAQDSVTVAPSGAGSVTMSYALYDYELKDIRVGADGVTYESAGAAVREQYKSMSDRLNAVTNKTFSAVDVLTNTAFSHVPGVYDTGYELVDSANYNTYEFIAVDDFSCYLSITGLYVSICTYKNGKRNADNANGRLRYYYNAGAVVENTLPTSDNPLSVAKGELVSITIANSDTTTLFSDSVAFGSVLAETVKLGATQIKQVVEAADKRCALTYKHGEIEDGATEELDIYIPASVGYIDYKFGHFVDAKINADNWRMSYANSVDDKLAKRFSITTFGEWEAAVRLADRPDFSGGVAHGDEVFTSFSVFLDGCKIVASSIAEATRFNELKIIETSNLYDPNDNKTVVAVHGKEYIFTENGLVINQTVEWLVEEKLSSCYLAMFPVSKAVSDSIYMNRDYAIRSTSDVLGQTHKSVSEVAVYSEECGFFGTFSVTEYPDFNDRQLLITDNGGGTYNKMYFVVCHDHQSKVGELWRSQTVYKLNATSV